MAFDKFSPIRTQVQATKAVAQTGGLPATNQAVVELCDQVTALLDALAAATTSSARAGVRPLLIVD